MSRATSLRSRRFSRGAFLVFLVVAVAFVAACSAILGLDAPTPPATPDAGGFLPPPSTDAAFDAPPACVPLDAGPDATAYSSMTESSTNEVWDTFDLTNINKTEANDYASGAFDGHYVYFAPLGNGLVTRFNPADKFTNASGWSTFDTTTLATPAAIFAGAVYDGHYVYFVPHSHVVARLDPNLGFASSAAWDSFDLAKIPFSGGALSGFSGSAFDGRYIYFVPNNDGASDGNVVRYDTAGAATESVDGGDAGVSTLEDLSRWSVYNIATASVSAAAAGFSGAAFDGHFVYLAPFLNGSSESGGYSGFVARYAIDGGFNAAGAWGTFDTATLNPSAYGFQGATFDSRYVYFAPNKTGVALRFDPTGALGARASYAQFDIGAYVKLASGATPIFLGAAFDGRFVYFAPAEADLPDAAVNAFSTVVRYDTANAFTETCAWTSYNVALSNPLAAGFFGAIFDGEYMYFAPRKSIAARFNTKTPPALPSVPAAGASFY